MPVAGRSWRATPDGLDLDPAGRLASPLDSYLEQQLRAGFFGPGSFPDAPELGAGLGTAMGGAEDPGELAERWRNMVLLDQLTRSAIATGATRPNGTVAVSLRAVMISGDAGTVTLATTADGSIVATATPE